MEIKTKIKTKIKSCIPRKIKTYFVGRNSKFLQGISKDMKGLEIGPSHSPIVPKREGYCVETVDHLSAEELKEHYKNDGVNLKAIEPVDYIWRGGSYYQLIQKEGYYDYIIASHMIEHSTDFCGFLKDCSKLLTKNGILRLAVPDKRYCFDHYRTTTGLAEIVNNFYKPTDLQSVGDVAEYYMNVVMRKGRISWDKPFLPIFRFGAGCRDKDFSFVHDHHTALAGMKRVEEGEYIDIHHYVFTPASFELLLNDLRLLEMIDLKIVHMWDTYGNEFIVTLQKTEEKLEWNPLYRQRLLRMRDKQNRV